jgi:FlaA1/EpsC-like NDP-sugar epimerase
MKRYFMSIKDAVTLVIEAGKKGKPGQTLILDMGEPKYILQVANELFNCPEFTITGTKEGEKLEEELMTQEEKLKAIKKQNFYIL